MLDLTPTRWTYTPDGATTVFGFYNLVLNPGDLSVTWVDSHGNPLALPGFTISNLLNGIPNPAGGTVGFNTAPAATAGSLLILERTTSQVTPGGDPSDYVQDPAATRRTKMDQLLALAQEALAKLKRTIGFSPLDPDGAIVLPPPALRANMALLFDAMGRLTVGAPLAAGVIVVSAFMQTCLGAANAAALLGDLGFSGFMQGLAGSANAGALMTSQGFSAFFQTLVGAADAPTLRGLIGVPTTWVVGSAINSAANIDLDTSGGGVTPGDERSIVPGTTITTITGSQRLARLVASADGLVIAHDGVNIISRTASNIVMRAGDAVTLANLGANKWKETAFDQNPVWKSANLAVVTGTFLAAVPHSLGKRVGQVRMFAAATANDNGWAAADFAAAGARIEIVRNGPSGNFAWQAMVDDTNVTIQIAAGGLLVLQKNSFNWNALTYANWNIWLEIEARD